MRPGRPTARALATAVTLAVLAPVALTTPAAAAEYRYWQYWRVAPDSGDWTFAATGPATRPAHGAVEGWRFGVSGAAGDDTPRWSADGLFELVCGSAPAADGGKRVAVVIDSGTTADAPPGEQPPRPVTGCAELPLAATGYDALQAVAAVRISGGMVCGITGYPARGCGTVVTVPSPSAAPSSNSPVGAAAGPAPGNGTVTNRPAASDTAATPTASGSPEPTPTGAGSAPAAAPRPGAADSEVAAAASASTAETSPVAERSTGSGSAVGTLLGLLLIAGVAAGAFRLRRGRA